ncbi:calcium-binding protein CP1-like [Telopea speciosissima]|uniref:calcium-binding protein CP1-like n=1 Tax=Telopea speciosissima TaxID=54955 RepID=UPI001CC6DEC7|nr:calcium-binding protein CP1-like [Telopea speciosissima]
MCPSGRTSSWGLEGVCTDFRPAFDLLDVDRDGKISLDDLRKFYSSFFFSGANITSDEDIDSMISVADSNKDGFVEYDEFERVLIPPSQFQSGDKYVMEDMFKVMDRDGDGKVGFDDLRTYMNSAGFPAGDQDVKAMIRLGGGDENDGISYEGLHKILTLDLDLAGK